MTRMTPLDDETPDHDLYEEAPPRSIFAATWFRALLVLIVLGVIGAVAVPYILDAMNPPPPKPSVAARSSPPATTPASPPAPAATPATPTTPAPAPSTPTPATSSTPPAAVLPSVSDKTADKTASDTKTALGEKSDKTSKADKAEKTDKKDAMVAATTTPADSKPVTTARPSANTLAKAPAAAKTETKSDEPATTTTTTATAKPAAATTKRAATKSTPPSAPKVAESGDWWVQVGAFREAGTAKKVADRLREQNYKVDESVRGGGESASKATASDKPAPSAAPAGSDQYDVFVSGGSAADLNKRLSGKGLAAEPSSNGVVVKPSLPLRDAVALSKDLAIEGFKVQVRRAGAADAATRAAAAEKPAPSASGGETLYRVRVGGFPDRATAMTTLKELEGKGYKPFLTRR
jgi:hypothetical protein